MIALKVYIGRNWKKDNCPTCGGTGVIGIGCCNGADCTCRGQPIEFRACKCGAEEPTEEELLKCLPKWVK